MRISRRTLVQHFGTLPLLGALPAMAGASRTVDHTLVVLAPRSAASRAFAARLGATGARTVALEALLQEPAEARRGLEVVRGLGDDATAFLATQLLRAEGFVPVERLHWGPVPGGELVEWTLTRQPAG